MIHTNSNFYTIWWWALKSGTVIKTFKTYSRSEFLSISFLSDDGIFVQGLTLSHM